MAKKSEEKPSSKVKSIKKKVTSKKTSCKTDGESANSSKPSKKTSTRKMAEETASRGVSLPQKKVIKGKSAVEAAPKKIEKKDRVETEKDKKVAVKKVTVKKVAEKKTTEKKTVKKSSLVKKNQLKRDVVKRSLRKGGELAPVKSVRLKAYWCVFSQTGQFVKRFEYFEKDEALKFKQEQEDQKKMMFYVRSDTQVIED